MAEHLNPFWFVPMGPNPPPTLSVPAWEALGPLLTGRIRLRLEALTPVHVAGEILTEGAERSLKMKRRRLYRRRHADGTERPVIDASTLRGCVRSWIEALTNSVAAVYNVGHEFEGKASYKKIRGSKQVDGRHLGFWVGHPPKRGESSDKLVAAYHANENDRWLHGDREGRKVINQPPHAFKRPALGAREGADLSGLRLDPATMLFGLVSTEEKSADPKTGPTPVHGVAGRVRFEDAWFGPQVAEGWSLDVQGNSSFGAPNPRLSNWWYFKPDHARPRRAQLDNGQVIHTVEFVGSQLRGRKVYFHQDPRRCHAWYKQHWVIPGGGQAPLAEVSTEILDTGTRSDTFHVHFERLPEVLVRLLLAGLRPSRGVRHKLGALRAFGYGSVAFHVEAVEVLADGPQGLDLTAGDGWTRRPDLEAQATTDHAAGTEPEATLKVPVDGEPQRLCSGDAWPRMRLVGTFPPDLAKHPLFIYPPYRQGRTLTSLERGFAQPLTAGDWLPRGQTDDPDRVKALLEKLWDQGVKEAIDINVYQQRATHYTYLRALAGLK